MVWLCVKVTRCDRYHTVQEFNKGVYDYIIATDESGACGEHDSDDEETLQSQEDRKSVAIPGLDVS